jgi:hypothetical protein
VAAVGDFSHRASLPSASLPSYPVTLTKPIKEDKGAIKWTRLSCRTFAANVVRLQLHVLAYNLGNFMRTLALPKAAEPWSLSSLREKLIKIGAKVVSHGRYVTFQMAEVAVSRQMFADILSLIARLRAQPAPVWAAGGSRMRQGPQERCALVRQSRAIQRFGAVNRKLRSPVASAARDLPLREPVRSAIPSQNHPQSGECRIKANPGEGDDWFRPGVGVSYCSARV